MAIRNRPFQYSRDNTGTSQYQPNKQLAKSSSNAFIIRRDLDIDVQLFEPQQENSVKPSEKRVVGRISNSDISGEIAVMRAKVAGGRQCDKLENPTLNNRARRIQSRVPDVRVELADDTA
jgi:hypothetical protein